MFTRSRILALAAALAALGLVQPALASHSSSRSATSPAARLSGQPNVGLVLGVSGGRLMASYRSRPHTYRSTPHTYRSSPRVYRQHRTIFHRHHRHIHHRHHVIHHRHGIRHHRQHHIRRHHGHRRPILRGSRCGVRSRR